jgi:vitamin B12 transporter
MSFTTFSSCRLFRWLARVVVATALFAAAEAHSASIRGVVTDANGARVTGATVALVQNGKVVATAVSVADGSYEILTGNSGRFSPIGNSQLLRGPTRLR